MTGGLKTDEDDNEDVHYKSLPETHKTFIDCTSKLMKMTMKMYMTRMGQ
jgi:hypothetical protein